MTDIERRNFLRRGVIGALAFQVAGGTSLLTPRQAHADAVTLRYFDDTQRALLGDFCEHLLPGAVKAGVAEFVDCGVGRKD